MYRLQFLDVCFSEDISPVTLQHVQLFHTQTHTDLVTLPGTRPSSRCSVTLQAPDLPRAPLDSEPLLSTHPPSSVIVGLGQEKKQAHVTYG